MTKLSPDEQRKQEHYRDARRNKIYDNIWQTVGKCAFCDLKEKYIFFEENGVVMTISLYAYIDGHFMIIPRRHVRSAKELTQKEWETVRKFTYIAKKLIKEVHGVKGMQLVQKDGSAAQSTVEHLHFHCIPFDKPDLCEWNYRQLKYTPLESAAIYKQASKKIIKADLKFDQKYQQPSGLTVVCDLIMLSSDKQILFQERKPAFRLEPDYITFPGGQVDNYEASLEQELIREVKEELGYSVKAKDLTLVSSRIDSIERPRNEKHLDTTYTVKQRFLRNTYLLKDVDPKSSLKPGDDTAKVVWVPLSKVAGHKRISPSSKEIIEAASL